MKIINFLSILMIVLADIAIYGIEATLQDELLKKYDNSYNHDDELVDYFSTQRNVHLDSNNNRFNLFRPAKQTLRLTCNKSPRVCRAKGSPGPSCCKKKCVNVLTDRRNCGKCGTKCKYNKICCNGKCVNPNYNKRHCGGCNNSCTNGGLCAFGLCSYA